MKKVKIGKNLSIGNGEKTFVIAEIGAKYWTIHEMKNLILIAKEAGADAVKIQSYKAELIAQKDAYFEFNNGEKISQYEFFKKYELSYNDHKELFDCAKKIGIILFSTPSNREDVDLLENFNPPIYKIGSDDLTNYPLLKYIAQLKKPIILSTGMSTLGEIEKAVETIEQHTDKIIILHCITAYPPKIEDANLKVIETLKKAFPYPVGFSDHFLSTISSAFSVIAGASVVEKHLTLRRKNKVGDYFVSLEPEEFRELIKNIRIAEKMMGSGYRKVFQSEKKWRKNARKSIAAAKDIKKGEIIKEEALTMKRPATGLSSEFINLFINKKAKNNIKKGEFLKITHIEHE